ncbi:MAG TPA: flagellar hook capping FlgD N-terminal domain-containing protein [Devosiaceae bacterium]|jgi:flagellar basal-body rod modification protein FlgD
MSVGGVSNNSGAGAAGSAPSTDNTTLAGNFDTFLSILTTQLQNQNPLDPLDTNQFTEQLVQFSGVEQQLKTNDFLQALMTNSQTSANINAVSYIGKEVTAAGVRSQLVDGQAVWKFNAEAVASDANISIKDSSGNVVYSDNGSLAAGPGQFVWDGIGSNGQTCPDGTYSITIDGKNLAGKDVGVSTSTVGKVTAVDLSGDQPVLTVGETQIKLSDVTSVKVPD